MISFEEFKSTYRETLTLDISLLGITDGEYTLELAWDFKDNEEKVVKTLNPDNSMTTSIPFAFTLMDTDRPFFINIKSVAMGEVICPNLRCLIQDLLTSDNLSICKDLENGAIKMQIEKEGNSYPIYNIALTALNLPLLAGLFGQCDPFMRILKKNPDFGTYTLVYESEVHRNISSPNFNAAKLSAQRLCDGDSYREIKVQVWDFSKRGGHYIVGEFKSNLHNLLLMYKNKTSVKLLSADGTKVHGTSIVKSLSVAQGPSLFKKISAGWKINLIAGIDCTGINLETQDLEERKNFICENAQHLCDKLGYMLQDGKLQYFGINGKCCTDNLYTNYIMDAFPISGDIEKNAFNHKQVKGDFFNRTIKNFIYNTLGGEKLKLQNFVKFAVDYSDESSQASGFKVFSIVAIYLWHIPEDINTIIEEYVNLKGRPTIFWFIYLGEKDQEKIQTLDSRKCYLIDDQRAIGTRSKTIVACTSYNADQNSLVRGLLKNTQHMLAYYKKKKTKQN